MYNLGEQTLYSGSGQFLPLTRASASTSPRTSASTLFGRGPLGWTDNRGGRQLRARFEKKIIKKIEGRTLPNRNFS